MKCACLLGSVTRLFNGYFNLIYSSIVHRNYKVVDESEESYMQTYYTAMNDMNYANNTCTKVHISKHSQQSTHGHVKSVNESGCDRNN